MMDAAGRMFVISSPSGGGKTTVVQEVRKREPSIQYSVSATTRPPRHGERHGIDYIFMNDQDFQDNINRGLFMEWARVHRYHYGTPRSPLLDWVRQGKTILLDLDVQGAVSIKQKVPESILIFLMPPSLAVLRERLEKRGTDPADVIDSRLRTAESEMRQSENYDVVLFNARLKETVVDLLALIRNSK
jgi:guanylate kinase